MLRDFFPPYYIILFNPCSGNFFAECFEYSTWHNVYLGFNEMILMSKIMRNKYLKRD